jgi:hypothetical protein
MSGSTYHRCAQLKEQGNKWVEIELLQLEQSSRDILGKGM